MLLTCEVRVRAENGRITLTVGHAALRQELLGEKDGDRPNIDALSRLSRTIHAETYRVRGEARILEDDQAAVAAVTAGVREQLLRTIALGRKWASELVNGEVDSLRALGEREKHSESYLYDALRGGCLSPRIIQAISEGQLAPNLGARLFKEGLPIDWDGQAKLASA